MQNFQEGEILLINKPYQWSSFDVVKKVRGLLNKHFKFSYSSKETTPKYKIKVGHAGTLDPLATGLMLICTGKQTKNIDQLQGKDKEYTGTFFIGATTPSFDKEKEIDVHYPTEHINDDLLIKTAKQFVGTFLQAPPVFSAVKVNGKRLYKFARNGSESARQPYPREITIHKFELTNISMPFVSFKIVCSKGTYIRAIARDFGKAIHSGAYLESLCRTKIGDYALENATDITKLEAALYEKS